MLLALDLDEDFIDEEGVAIATMATLQSSSVYSSEFDAPQADRFTADCDTSFSEKVFDISVTQIEAVIEPDSVGYDIGWESVAFIGIHLPILSILGQLTCMVNSWEIFLAIPLEALPENVCIVG
jgi:hypothetical protein